MIFIVLKEEQYAHVESPHNFNLIEVGKHMVDPSLHLIWIEKG